MMCWRLFGNSEIYRQNDGCFQRDVPKGNLQVLADTIIYEYGQAILFRFFRMLTWRVARVLLRSKSTAFLFQSTPPRGGDLDKPITEVIIYGFQSTPPRGGRR